MLPALSVAALLIAAGSPGAEPPDELDEIQPAWIWSYHLARLASEPGGETTLEPSLLELDATAPRSGDRLRRDLDDGWTTGRGLGLRLETGLRVPVTRASVARLRVRAGADRHVPDLLRIIEGGIWARTGPFRWSIGRQRFFLSPAPETSLLLSNNAPPLDALSIGSRDLWGLPWGLGRLGWMTALAYLDDPHRTIPYPLLWGAEIAWRPVPRLSIEIRRTALFGGAGRTSRLAPEDILDILLGRNENLPGTARGPNDSDQLLSYALRWRWPVPRFARIYAHQIGLEDLEIYYEYAGEDALRRGFPTATGRLGGLRAVVSGWEGSAAYAETVDDANRWYEHIVYRSGYTYRGWVLAHPPGGDTRWVRIRFGRPWLCMSGISVQVDWERFVPPETGGLRETPAWEMFRGTGRWWRSPMPGLRLQLEVEGSQRKTGSTAQVPPRFPDFVARLSVIFGDVPRFDSQDLGYVP